ncbi:MFS transporter [Pandoraea sp.]|uniref:MFS transporter n=1 Tax=Pandoraea sp. TaxID=1883445 RepID=UPI0012202FF9|nr:MFS transporter [Pandoraea sp.]TAL56231.1 MAG: MFS transporter [Pandoraea sp.]TAM19185.1 MAG: MFS transporter [Pandoraea sp.]
MDATSEAKKGMLQTPAAVSQRARIYPWIVIAMGSMVYMSNYTDKALMSVVAPHLIANLHISKITMGWIFSAFAITYTILQPLLAYLSDIVGPRRSVGLMVLWYGAFTLLSGVTALNLGQLAWMRAAAGAGEAASMPAATGGVSPWVPPGRRALSQGIMHAATRLGAALTVPVGVASIVAFGIPGPFWVFGSATVLIGLVWLAVYRSPATGHAHRNQLGHGKQVWAVVLKSKSMWALCLADFCYFYTLTIYLTWLPTFLIKDHHFTMLKVGIYGFLPFIGGMLGSVLGGALCDRLCARTGNKRLWRRLIPSAGMVCSVLLLLPAIYAQSQFVTIMLFSCSFFFLDATISVFWAIAMDMGGSYASTSAGWMNTWANVGGIISPVAFGALVQWSGSWTLPFLVASGLMLVGAGFVWLIDTEMRLSDLIAGPAGKRVHA